MNANGAKALLRRVRKVDLRDLFRGRVLWASLGVGAVLVLAFNQWISFQFLPSFAPDDPVAALGMMWQVHAAFLGIGFAGLALAAQVYSEPPIAPAAARRGLLDHLRLSDIVIHGLASSALIACATFWAPSDAAVPLLFACFAVPSVLLVADGYRRLGALYMSPTRVDGLIAEGLEDHAQRATKRIAKHMLERNEILESIVSERVSLRARDEAEEHWDFRVGRPRGAVAGFNGDIFDECLQVLDDALAKGITATAAPSAQPTMLEGNLAASYLVVRARPNSILAAHDVTFSVFGEGVDALGLAARTLLEQRLAGAIVYHGPDWIHPRRELDRELGGIQDAACVALLSGGNSRGGRALELLDGLTGQIWSQAGSAVEEEVRDIRSWLFRPFAIVEWAVAADPRACEVLISSATSRSMASIKALDLSRFVLCLGSYLRIWNELLHSIAPGVEDARERVLVAVQNLAEFALRGSSPAVDSFRRESAWTFVAFARAALDAGRHAVAARAIGYHVRLFKYSDEAAGARVDVLIGRLVLAGWMLRMRDREKATDPRLLLELTATEPRAAILAALDAAGKRDVQITSWQRWEGSEALPLEATISEISSYVDRAAALAYVRGSGRPTEVTTQEQASDLDRLIARIEVLDTTLLEWLGLEVATDSLVSALRSRREAWSAEQSVKLSHAEISASRVHSFRLAFATAMDGPTRLANFFPCPGDSGMDSPWSRLGFNFLVSKSHFVDEVFDSTYADPNHMGGQLGRAALAAEEGIVIDRLREVGSTFEAGLDDFVQHLEEFIGSRAPGRGVVLLPFADLIDDKWWQLHTTLKATAAVVRSVDFGAGHDGELMVVDLDASLQFRRRPDTGGGLEVAGESGFGIGVFSHEDPAGKPRARVEVAEWVQVVSAPSPAVEIWRLS